ncbi:MAG TPA: polysaccharide biosynthesis protein, partial [Candidatus Lokiarchaeia archaeon]
MGIIIQENNYQIEKELNEIEFLISGGSGSLGNAITKLLCEKYKPKGIRIYSRDEFKQKVMKTEFDKYNIPIAYCLGDVRDLQRLKLASRGVDIIIHTAALKDIVKCERDPIEAIQTNINGSMNIVYACIENNIKKCILISTDKCLDFHTRIETEKGILPIAKIVKEKMNIKVKSYDGENIIWSKITNWYKNKLNNRNLYKISYQNSSFSKSSKRRLIVTEDHLISTPLGYYQAKDLKNNDVIFTGETKPNRKQLEMIIGTLLGDSCLVNKKRSKNDKRQILSQRPNMIFGHAENQLAWLNLKYYALKEINKTSIIKQKSKNIKKQNFYKFKISCCGFLQDLYPLFYKENKKIINLSLIKE